MYPGVDPADSVKDDAKREESAGEMHEAALNGDLATSKLQNAVQQVMDKYAVTDAWTQQELYFEITCPSGQKCLAKKLTTMDLVESDLIDEIDFFTKSLMPVEGEEQSEGSQFSHMLKDPNKRARLFNLLDGLLHIGVVKPKVHLVPKDIDYRKWQGPTLPAGEVWANMIDFQDKIMIFGELNKPLDEIKTFRIEPEIGVASMATMESIP